MDNAIALQFSGCEFDPWQVHVYAYHVDKLCSFRLNKGKHFFLHTILKCILPILSMCQNGWRFRLAINRLRVRSLAGTCICISRWQIMFIQT